MITLLPVPAALTESERLAVLRGYGVLDTPFEAQFDDIVKIASQLCDTPIAMISLIDSDRQWFKAATGLSVRETPISMSVCAKVMFGDDLVVIPDATLDDRSRDNPLVTDAPHLRFYAGAPLKTPGGAPLGMVCVLDYQPRTLTDAQGQVLKALAHQVMVMLEMKLAIAARQDNERQLQAALDDARAQNARFRLLCRINEKLIAGRVDAAVLDGIFWAVAVEIGADIFTNYMAHPEQPGHLTLTSSRGLGADAARHRDLDQRAQLSGRIVASRMPLILEDIGAGADPEALAATLPFGIQAYVGYPLLAQGRLLGTVAFCSRSRPRFEPAELEIVHTVCHQISTALDRGRLLEELSARESDLRMLLDKAEAASVAKTDFLANMSHEIRTPMNAIIGLSHILALSEPLTARQREFIATLRLSADSMLALINDLLDITKIEARTMEMERIPFALDRVTREVVTIMEGKRLEKGLDLAIDDAAVRGRRFMGDPMRLRQIILNLVSNAIKFTDQGRIAITISCAPVPGAGREIVSISVTDTGIGIPRGKQNAIFEKFTQADSSITRKYGGTGLGLAITRTLVTLMQGTIAVISEDGAGSTFRVDLPLDSADAA